MTSGVKQTEASGAAGFSNRLPGGSSVRRHVLALVIPVIAGIIASLTPNVGVGKMLPMIRALLLGGALALLWRCPARWPWIAGVSNKAMRP